MASSLKFFFNFSNSHYLNIMYLNAFWGFAGFISLSKEPMAKKKKVQKTPDLNIL